MRRERKSLIKLIFLLTFVVSNFALAKSRVSEKHVRYLVNQIEKYETEKLPALERTIELQEVAIAEDKEKVDKLQSKIDHTMAKMENLKLDRKKAVQQKVVELYKGEIDLIMRRSRGHQSILDRAHKSKFRTTQKLSLIHI